MSLGFGLQRLPSFSSQPQSEGYGFKVQMPERSSLSSVPDANPIDQRAALAAGAEEERQRLGGTVGMPSMVGRRRGKMPPQTM